MSRLLVVPPPPLESQRSQVLGYLFVLSVTNHNSLLVLSLASAN